MQFRPARIRLFYEELGLLQRINGIPGGADCGGGRVLAVELAGHGQAHGHALPAERHGTGLGGLGGQMEVADSRLLVQPGDVGSGNAGACHQVDAVGGKAPEGPQIFQPLGGGGHLAGGQDGLDAEIAGCLDGLEAIPAHVEAPVQRGRGAVAG